ncbi:hypothetical protein HYV73_00930 [Candidatus Uhrbacteria bacterium]|nr:hypothetical protein [Candidatus Uhrbacteria bacterium]
MRLPQQAIHELCDLWKVKYGVELDDGQARAYAEHLLELMSFAMRPMPSIATDKPRNNGPP